MVVPIVAHDDKQLVVVVAAAVAVLGVELCALDVDADGGRRQRGNGMTDRDRIG